MENEWLYGLHSVQTLLKSDPERILEIHIQKGRRDQRLQKILQLASHNSLAVSEVSRQELDRQCGQQHQGVAALCKPGKLADERFLFELIENLPETPLLLVLDGITDPHNLGACLRTAEAAGVHAVITPKDRSVGMTPVVRKVACGAADIVPLVPVTNLARCLKKLQEAGVWLVGTSDKAEKTLFEHDLRGPLALVMGAEGDGMRRLTSECCDTLVNIPMAGEISSLNVSVATGVCLFEAVRQRGGA